MPVKVEKKGPVTTVILHRPEVRNAVDRETADAVLREASAVTGVPAWRRAIMWAAVRAFGGSHWDEKPISA